MYFLYLSQMNLRTKLRAPSLGRDLLVLCNLSELTIGIYNQKVSAVNQQTFVLDPPMINMVILSPLTAFSIIL